MEEIALWQWIAAALSAGGGAAGAHKLLELLLGQGRSIRDELRLEIARLEDNLRTLDEKIDALKGEVEDWKSKAEKWQSKYHTLLEKYRLWKIATVSSGQDLDELGETVEKLRIKYNEEGDNGNGTSH